MEREEGGWSPPLPLTLTLASPAPSRCVFSVLFLSRAAPRPLLCPDPPMADLSEFIDWRALEALNVKQDKGVENALKQVRGRAGPRSRSLSPPPSLSLSLMHRRPRPPGPPPLPSHTHTHTHQGYRDDGGLFAESDCDAEVLLNIPFTQAVRLTGLALAAPAAGAAGADPDATPRAVRLFVNRPSLGFAEAASDPAAQELELSAADAAHPGAVLPLRAARFKGVTCLGVYVSSNAGDAETTQIGALRLLGSAGETFDVAAIKKAGEEGGPA